MKKLLLSVSALVIALGTVSAQNTYNAFDYNFTSTATGSINCLYNLGGTAFANSVAGNGDGAGNSGVSTGSDNSLQITSNATSTSFNNESQAASGTNVNPIIFDIYETVGSGVSAQCNNLRSDGNYISLARYKKVSITAKASAPMNLRTELGTGYGSATNQTLNIFEVALTTNYQTFTFDYAGKFDGFDSTKINVVRFKFNVGTGGFTGTVNIADISFGQAADTSSSAVTSVNNDEIVANSVTVYPNPATGKVSVDLSSLQGVNSVKLMNSSGGVVSDIQANGGTASFSVEDVAKGLYFIQIATDNNIIRKKLMIQ